MEESTLSKNIRTEIVVSCWEDGQRVWRTVDNLEGDISSTMVVPSIESAIADLKQDWQTFEAALNTHGRQLSPKERGAISDAASNMVPHKRVPALQEDAE